MASPPGNLVRYAVVGLGHIAQAAVLPAFAHARRNSRLVAVVSDDPAKRKAVSRAYRLDSTFSYDDYGACLEQVDAVYIARFRTRCMPSTPCVLPWRAYTCSARSPWP